MYVVDAQRRRRDRLSAWDRARDDSGEEADIASEDIFLNEEVRIHANSGMSEAHRVWYGYLAAKCVLTNKTREQQARPWDLGWDPESFESERHTQWIRGRPSVRSHFGSRSGTLTSCVVLPRIVNTRKTGILISQLPRHVFFTTQQKKR